MEAGLGFIKAISPEKILCDPTRPVWGERVHWHGEEYLVSNAHFPGEKVILRNSNDDMEIVPIAELDEYRPRDPRQEVTNRALRLTQDIVFTEDRALIQRVVERLYAEGLVHLPGDKQ